MDIEDLINEGNIGLITAAKKFDPSQNVRFTSYAVWWIRQSLRKLVFDTARDVRIPLSRKDEFFSGKWSMASLDVAYRADDGFLEPLVCSVHDIRYDDPDDAFIKEEAKSAVRLAVSRLPEKEKDVINLRYGFDTGVGRSLKEIGEILNYSKEGVRQIEQRALSRLRMELAA